MPLKKPIPLPHTLSLPSDLVGFSTWASTLCADKVMATLNDLFSRLDTILLEEMPELYKVLMDSLVRPEQLTCVELDQMQHNHILPEG